MFTAGIGAVAEFGIRFLFTIHVNQLFDLEIEYNSKFD
jgi:hypothetical protein